MISEKIRSVELLLAEMACRVSQPDWQALRAARAELRDAADQVAQYEGCLRIPLSRRLCEVCDGQA